MKTLFFILMCVLTELGHGALHDVAFNENSVTHAEEIKITMDDEASDFESGSSIRGNELLAGPASLEKSYKIYVEKSKNFDRAIFEVEVGIMQQIPLKVQQETLMNALETFEKRVQAWYGASIPESFSKKHPKIHHY